MVPFEVWVKICCVSCLGWNWPTAYFAECLRALSLLRNTNYFHKTGVMLPQQFCSVLEDNICGHFQHVSHKMYGCVKQTGCELRGGSKLLLGEGMKLLQVLFVHLVFDKLTTLSPFCCIYG